MTYKENITAILECYFSGFKKEIIDSACNRILEQEPKTDSWSIKDVADTFKKHGLIRVQEPSGNAIDRAEAIKIASGYCHPANVAKELAKLPSVNPMPCEDAISRQAVLDMATTIQTDDYSGNEIIEVVDVDDVKALPPVTPQPKTGHWKKWIKYPGRHRCSVCKKPALNWADGNENLTAFCPYCGAKMIEPQESEG